ncbi:hypothetical protein COV20_04130 [Candidatus Woesearchaeota archaeon CG10_big_fil_rev_8_21_14_0_10_45_16]|nr:MAG: hypothetical protein COV20_04130 [Candidatus Woesearchaeota archaeon CG10_big_fil_rev_8_21_14_0_10_45_16]
MASIITAFRFLALPLLIYLVLQQTPLSSLLALAIMLLAVLSDVIDNLIFTHDVGSFYDPFADKLLVIGLLTTFTALGHFSVYFLLFFAFRDVFVGVIRWLAGQEDVEVPGEIYGKVLVGFQYLILILIFFNQYLMQDQRPALSFLILLQDIVIIVALIVALSSIIYYFHGYGKALSQRRHGKVALKVPLTILANNRSRGFHDGYRRRLLYLFSRRRNASLLFLSKKSDMFKGVEKKTTPHVIIAGGDGSFESALNHKPLQKNFLGFFPLGAGNAYYSYFYKGKRFEYLRSRFRFQEDVLNVAEIEWDRGKRQTTFLSIGIDADVIRFGVRRSQNGFLDYMRGSWKALWHAPGRYDFVCKVDGRKQNWNNVVNVILGTHPYYGFGLRWYPGRMRPAEKQIYAAACINTHLSVSNKLVRLWSLILPSFGLKIAPLVLVHGRKIEITAKKPFPLQAGGEFLGYTKRLSLKVVREQKVLVI